MDAFGKAATLLLNRIKLFTCIPITSIGIIEIKKELDEIGKLKD